MMLPVQPERPLQLQPRPGYFDHRIKMFDELKAEYDANIAGTRFKALEMGFLIVVQLNHENPSLLRCPTARNAAERAGRRPPWTWQKSFRKACQNELSSPRLVRSSSERVFRSNNCQVDGELWDLERPLEKSCKLELLDFEHPEGEVFFLCCL